MKSFLLVFLLVCLVNCDHSSDFNEFIPDEYTDEGSGEEGHLGVTISTFEDVTAIDLPAGIIVHHDSMLSMNATLTTTTPSPDTEAVVLENEMIETTTLPPPQSSSTLIHDVMDEEVTETTTFMPTIIPSLIPMNEELKEELMTTTSPERNFSSTSSEFLPEKVEVISTELETASKYENYLFYYTSRSYFHYSKNYCIDPLVSQTTEDIMTCLKVMQDSKAINLILNKLSKMFESRVINFKCGNNSRELTDPSQVSLEDSIDFLSKSWIPPGFLTISDNQEGVPTRDQIIRETFDTAIVSIASTSNNRLGLTSDGKRIVFLASDTLFPLNSCNNNWMESLLMPSLMSGNDNETSSRESNFLVSGSLEQEAMFEMIERVISLMESSHEVFRTKQDEDGMIDVQQVREEIFSSSHSLTGVNMESVWNHTLDFISNRCQRIVTTRLDSDGDKRIYWQYRTERETLVP